MAFDLPAIAVVGTVATKAGWADPVRNSLKALRGIDGTEIFLPAAEGVAGSTQSYATEYGRYSTVILTSGSYPLVAFSLKVPDNFATLTAIKAVWMSAATSGDMYWTLAANYAASGEDSVNTYSTQPGFGATGTTGQLKWNVQSPANVLTLTGLAAGDYLGIELARNSTHASDTLTTKPAYLLGILFQYAASS